MFGFRRVLLPCVGFGLFLLTWEIAGRMLGSAILAPPTLVAVDYVAQIWQGEMFAMLLPSIKEAGIAWLASCVIGMPLGIAMGRWWAADAAFHPWVAMLVVTSAAAVVPLLILFLGTDAMLRLAVIFLATVFNIVLTTYNGAKGINPNQIAVGRSFGASPLKIFCSIMLPSVYPYLMTGARIGLIHALRAMVTVELFIISGYGGLIHQAGLAIETGPLLGLLVNLTLTSLVLDQILRLVGRLVAPWYEQQRISSLEASGS